MTRHNSAESFIEVRSRESTGLTMASELTDDIRSDNENLNFTQAKEESVLEVTGTDANNIKLPNEDEVRTNKKTVDFFKTKSVTAENVTKENQSELVHKGTHVELEHKDNTVCYQDHQDTNFEEATYLNQETTKSDERFDDKCKAKKLDQRSYEQNANNCDRSLEQANPTVEQFISKKDNKSKDDNLSTNFGSQLSKEDTYQDGQFNNFEEFSHVENENIENKVQNGEAAKDKNKDKANSPSQTLRIKDESTHRKLVQFSQEQNNDQIYEHVCSNGNTNTNREQSAKNKNYKSENADVFSEQEAEVGGQNLRNNSLNKGRATEVYMESGHEIKEENSQMDVNYAKQYVSETGNANANAEAGHKDDGDRNNDEQVETYRARVREQQNTGELDTDAQRKDEESGDYVHLLGENETEENKNDGNCSTTDRTDETDATTDLEPSKEDHLDTETEKKITGEKDVVHSPKNEMEKVDEEIDKTNQDDNREATAKDIDSKRENLRKGEEEDIDKKDNENASTKSATIIYVGQQTEDKHEEDVVDSKTDEKKKKDDEQEIDKTSSDRQQSDAEESTTKKKRKVRNVIGITSDGEEIYDTSSEDDQRAGDDDSSLDDAERERRKIGGKKGHMYTPAGPLTTVLVSRHDEERRRNKQRSKSKKQKMRGLAKKKTKVHGVTKQSGHEEDIYSSEEDEVRRHGTREAPFIEQYRYKKRIENKLNEEDYWKEPIADEDPLRRKEDIDSLFGSKTSSVESDYEDEDTENEMVVGPDGVLTHKKKSTKNKNTKLHRNITGDINESKARDAINYKVTSVEKAEDSKGIKEKDIYTEKIQGDVTDKDKSVSQEQNNQELRESGKTISGSVLNDDKRINEDTQNGQHKEVKHRVGRTHLIHVKEHQENRDYLQKAEMKTNSAKGDKSKSNGNNLDNKTYDLYDSYLEKASDTDSGVEDEEILDVVLTSEQQQMVVNVLFDEDMRLRPEFEKDESERIVRKLDNTVIYDPHTGRFTFRRQLGRLFNVPRLKRNKKGRPTGGYIEDDYGPKKPERQKSGRSRCSRRDSESHLSLSDSPIYDKRSRGDVRNVGFSVPDDDDIESVSVGDLEFHKRGRRDLGSGIRRKLKNRLFRNKRKRPDSNAKSPLPAVHLKRAWTSDTLSSYSGVDGAGHGELSPVIHRGGRPGYSTPGSQRKGGTNPQQWQKYREGLESDRRILAGLQDKSSVDGRGDRGPSGGSFAELDGESSSDPVFNEASENEETTSYSDRPEFCRGPNYWSEDGRFIVRERGCPELPPPPLFNIVRRPGTITREEQSRGNSNYRQHTAPKSAPVLLQNHNEHSPRGLGDNESGSSEGLSSRTIGDNQLSFIDDNRLRRLLEELYRDKKYFDRYVETTEPQSEVVIHTKGLAEHGRGYLLDRADYWEKRGPLPSRPTPQTEIGWKMYRQQALMDSARTSEHDSTMTITPEIRPYTVPGYVDSSCKTDERSPRSDTDNQNQSETFV